MLQGHTSLRFITFASLGRVAFGGVSLLLNIPTNHLLLPLTHRLRKKTIPPETLPPQKFLQFGKLDP